MKLASKDGVRVHALEKQIFLIRRQGQFVWKNSRLILGAITPQFAKGITVILEMQPVSAFRDGRFRQARLVKLEWAVRSKFSKNDSSCIMNAHYRPDLFTKDGLEEVFPTERERFQLAAKRYQPRTKCGEGDGNSKAWYLCEQTGDWHNGRCGILPLLLSAPSQRCQLRWHGTGSGSSDLNTRQII